MKLGKIALTILLVATFSINYSQSKNTEMLSEIRAEGFLKSQAMGMLSELTDVYGQRLTGSREYYAAAKWISEKMKSLGLENVHFENYCDDCRGWSMKSFNVEMTTPNFMHINAYPLAMSISSNGIVEGEVIYIPSF